MLKIHRPIAFWIGTIILVVSIVGYQNFSLDRNTLLTMVDGLGDGDSHQQLWFYTDDDANDNGFQSHGIKRIRDTTMTIAVFTGGIVLGVLTILYGLIPGRTKE